MLRGEWHGSAVLASTGAACCLIARAKRASEDVAYTKSRIALAKLGMFVLARVQ